MSAIAKDLFLGSVFAAMLLGQSVSVAPSATDRNTPGSFTLTLDSPQGKAPVAIQWEFAIPAVLNVKVADLKAGKAAQAAGKSLTCASKTGAGPGNRYACILEGGQAVIANGPMAIVSYRAQADAQGAPIRVGIENVIGVSSDGKRIPIRNTDAMITIR